jgi:hypothetical protein
MDTEKEGCFDDAELRSEAVVDGPDIDISTFLDALDC